MVKMAFHGFWLRERKGMADASHLFDFHTPLRNLCTCPHQELGLEDGECCNKCQEEAEGLADATVSITTLLYTKHIVAILQWLCMNSCNSSFPFINTFVVSVLLREPSIFLTLSHRLWISSVSATNTEQIFSFSFSRLNKHQACPSPRQEDS